MGLGDVANGNGARERWGGLCHADSDLLEVSSPPLWRTYSGPGLPLALIHMEPSYLTAALSGQVLYLAHLQWRKLRPGEVE